MKNIAALLLRILLVLTVSFALLRTVPRDPARLALGPAATEESVAALRAIWGLDSPWPTQYWEFLRRAITLSFGSSFRLGRSAREVVIDSARVTLIISALSILLASAFAWTMVWLVHFSVQRAHWLRAIETWCSFLNSLPPFLWAVLIAILFVILIPLVPLIGLGASRDLSSQVQLVVPASAIAVTPALALVRLFTSQYRTIEESSWYSTLDCLQISSVRKLIFFVTPALAYSWLAYSSNQLLLVFGGSIFVETIFSLAGIGALAVRSLLAFDLPVLEVLIVLTLCGFVSIDWFSRLLSKRLDPRVHD